MNQQIAQGASRKEAVRAYAYEGLVDQKNILHLMAFTDDAELRKLLAEEANKKNKSLDVSVLQEKATRLNRIMREHDLNFKESQSLTVTGTRAWLLQGTQLVRDERIISDIFWNITSMVLGRISVDDTKRVFASVQNHLFLGMKNNLTDGFFNFFRSQEETGRLVREAEERYKQRIQRIKF